MCRRIECEVCGRPTYAGCGAHVEQVLAGVPAAERCACRSQPVAPHKPEPEARARRAWQFFKKR